MGAITTTVEAPSKVPAETMYKGFLLDMDNLIPKVVPQAITKVEILEGDGGVGTVKLVTLGDLSEHNSLKQKIDEIDKEALTYTYTIIDGDILLGKLESIVNSFKVVPTEEGCIIKNTTTYNPKDDVVIPEEKIKESTEKSGLIFKAVEAYLLANPTAY